MTHSQSRSSVSISLGNCTNTWPLSAFADEAAGTCDQQIAALQRAGLRHVDIRGVDGFNISALPVEKAREVAGKLKQAGIAVAMFGSPLGKIDITDDFQGELARLEHMANLVDVLECRAVRIFSYFNKTKKSDQEWERESLQRLARLRDRAVALGLVLYHENERHIFGESVANVLKIAKALRSPQPPGPGPGAGATTASPFRLIFDFDNFNQAGFDVWDGWLKLRDLTDAFHLKDSDAAHQHVPVGQGTGKVREILADAVKRNWHGPASVEPHLMHSAAVMATGPSGLANSAFKGMKQADSFHVAVEAAKGLLGEVGAKAV